MRGAVLLVLLALVGCGGGGSSSPDAGVDGGGIAAPAPPASPMFTPCPTGWRAVDDPDGVTLCDPWPAGGMATCAADEAHFHEGEVSHSPIGANVQTAGFDIVRITDGVVYVDNDINLAADQLEVPSDLGP